MQEVKIQNLVLNVLTQEQFEGAEKDASQLYLTPDTSIDSSEKGVANGVASLDTNGKVPAEQIPVATASALGVVKPDGTTITATEDGTISAAISGEGVATKADVQSLQTQINSLNIEVTGMLGRMNFNARVDFMLSHGQSYTVPSKGYLWVDYTVGELAEISVYINGGILTTTKNVSAERSYIRLFVPISEGDVVSASPDTIHPLSPASVSGFFVPQI